MAEAFIHWRNGNVLHVAGRYGQAAELFQQSIDAYPTAEGHTFLGWSLSELGRFEDAIAERTRFVPQPGLCARHCGIGENQKNLGRRSLAELSGLAGYEGANLLICMDRPS